MIYLPYILKVLRPHRKRMVLALVSMLGIMLVDLGSPLVIALLIDHVIGLNRYDLLPPLMLLFLFLPFAASFFTFLNGYTLTLLGQRVIFDIRLELYRRIHQLHCRYMHNTTTGKLMERLRGDVLQLQRLMTSQGLGLLVQLVTGLVMVFVMLLLSVKLTLLVFAGMTLYAANYKWLVPRIRKVQRRYRRKLERLSGLAQERLSGTLVVKSFGQEKHETHDFVKRNFAAERVFHRYQMFNVNYSTASNLVTWMTYAGVVILGVLLVLRGEVTFGIVMAFLAFSMRLLEPAAMLAELSNELQQGRVALDRIFELMNATPDVINQPGIKLPHLRGEVCFKNVCFQYDPNNPVLRNFNLHVKPGQTVALVGKTGCGKSTIVNLLYRFYDIDSGELTVDGHEIRSFETRWYRRNLAVVPQEPIILDSTIAENIAYGRPGASREQIEQAARMAELGEVIDRLDHGLDTSLGAYGAKLSVGEKQRLCIARAILSDPVILILDEATSSLDTRSEALIQLAMKRVMTTKRTSFIVAHRLSTIVNADLIVVLDGGRAVEMGNHAQLMQNSGGRYRRLYVTQTKTTVGK
ncbi:MAG TPA: ABC transporter ATP-binding protein, partial [Phycisphaerae bacterium]|nr:ABC transporter ATP-binding protein [Phycisphaerae bacterium]